MRNNAAYLPENPIVYIIFPESIHNRASFFIFVDFYEVNLFQDETMAFLFMKQAHNSVNTPMLPSFTSGCREPVHPDVKDGNMGMSGN